MTEEAPEVLAAMEKGRTLARQMLGNGMPAKIIEPSELTDSPEDRAYMDAWNYEIMTSKISSLLSAATIMASAPPNKAKVPDLRSCALALSVLCYLVIGSHALAWPVQAVMVVTTGVMALVFLRDKWDDRAHNRLDFVNVALAGSLVTLASHDNIVLVSVLFGVILASSVITHWGRD
jgi:hypothetical protein